MALPSSTKGVVQLVRTPACQAGGREFESRRSRTEGKYQVSLNKSLTSLWGFFVSSLIIYIHLYPKGGHGNGGHTFNFTFSIQ